MGPFELRLTAPDVQTLVGGLSRCTKAKSGKGTPKAAIPVYVVARYYAKMLRQYVYGCGGHWHLTKAVPHGTGWQSPLCKPHNIEVAIQDAITHGQKVGLRMRVYGARNTNGRWYYQSEEVLDLGSQCKDR